MNDKENPYPVTTTMKGYMYENQKESYWDQELADQAVEYIGEMEHDESLMTEGVHLNQLAGAIADYTMYLMIVRGDKA